MAQEFLREFNSALQEHHPIFLRDHRYAASCEKQMGVFTE
jgi:hypothetical protein